MREFTDTEKDQIAMAVEALGEIIAAEADGHDDDELVCIQPVVDAIADACGKEHVQLPDDGWIEAGVIRQRARELRAAMARRQI